MILSGFRNLDVLKLRLLPSDMNESTDYDSDIHSIGLGVAALFDSFTGRELRRNTAASFECPAGAESVVLKSYPIESITSVTLWSGSSSAVYTSAVMATQKASGIVDFGGSLGTHTDRLVIVSSGGYYCDPAVNSTLPTGATALPDDLLQAWYAQCRAVCDAENIFRSKAAANSTDKDKRDPSLRLDTLDLLPSVKRTLNLYRRMP